jgi:hypothetical protein
MAFPLRLCAVVLLVFLVGCGVLFPDGARPQGGSPEIANQSADAFLRAVVAQRASEAWSHLTPGTRDALYQGDEAAFAHDVRSGDWSGVEWEFGPVVDHDISWGVHVRVVEGPVPPFMVERGLAANWAEGLVLLIQTPFEEPYMVAGQGLDTRL